MKKNKFCFIIFFILITHFTHAFDLGLSLGGGYETWEESSLSTNSKEISNYLFDISAISTFKIGKRLRLFPQLGFTYAFDFQNTPTNSTPSGTISNDSWTTLYAGSRITFIIHPEYSPFLGGGIYARYYDRMLYKDNKLIFTLTFTGGTKIFKQKKSALWLVIDYGLFNSEYKDYFSSYFMLNFMYLFEL